MVVDEQQHADQQEQRELKEDDDPAGEQRQAAFAFVAGGEQTLHQQLFGAVAGGGEEAAAQQAGPEAVVPVKEGGREREAEIEHLKFVRGWPALTTCGQPPGIRCRMRKKLSKRAADVEDHLDDIGPDNGRHAAFEGVEEREADDDRDGNELAGAAARWR